MTMSNDINLSLPIKSEKVLLYSVFKIYRIIYDSKKILLAKIYNVRYVFFIEHYFKEKWYKKLIN